MSGNVPTEILKDLAAQDHSSELVKKFEIQQKNIERAIDHISAKADERTFNASNRTLYNMSNDEFMSKVQSAVSQSLEMNHGKNKS